MQCPHHLVLVQPRDFAFNLQTAVSNAFQQEKNIGNYRQLVQNEFDNLLQVLEKNEINFTVFDSPQGVNVPDAVFPNNWFAVMPGGELLIFPMYAPNRRDEVNPVITDFIETNFVLTAKTDLTARIAKKQPLEGTGSIVFDHDAKVAYACESDRTSIILFEELCAKLGYAPVSFLAMDLNNVQVYHTNVVMSVGAHTVIACMEALQDPFEAALVRKKIATTGKQLMEISFAQMSRFCGNVMQVCNRQGERIWLMSTTAFEAFEPAQRNILEQSGRIVHTPIPTIETLGGGSLRCMLGGIHAPYRK